ncbi:MAG TPA: phosphatidylglycerophosphatase A [Deltaproteobacteria bacterium]|nr:phosphatidylglycerophosphatase A [Deltaproteobacteria bacterium]
MDKNKTKKLAKAIATGFYTGYSPFAPGTVGTLIVGIPLFLLLAKVPVSIYGVVCIVLFGIGCKVSDFLEKDSGQDDPSEVVIDEIVGYLISTIGLSVGVVGVVVSFFAFRGFDIVKPWPIRDVEKQLQKGLGIMTDDVIAGLYANILTRLFLDLFFH